MSKLVYSALALTLVSSPGIASENEWSSLDQEIANLSASLSAQNPLGPKLGGYVRTSWRHSSDVDMSGLPGQQDQSGFKLDNVRVEISGDAGSDYSYKVSFDLKNGSAEIRDAFAAWKLADTVNGTMGNFKAPFLRSGLGSNATLLFLQRSALGAFFDTRDLGLMFSGAFDTVSWSIAAQNSNDGKSEEYAFTGRLTASVMGSGVGKVEGAYGAGDETNLTVGIAMSDKQDLDKGAVLGLEAYFTSGPFSASFELADFDDGDPFGAGWGSKTLDYGLDNFGLNTDPGNTTPWDAVFSYMFTDMYEAAIRWEDADDASNMERITVAVNRYVQGHDIKWTASWMSVNSDVAANEVDEIGVGLTVAF